MHTIPSIRPVARGYHDAPAAGGSVTVIHEREVGAHRKRVEDPRLVRGEGQYVDDIHLPGTLEVAFLRSVYPHARILRLDASVARQQPGVVDIWDGARVKDVPRLPNTMPFKEKNVSPLPPLASERVTLAGYPIAAVVADDRYRARDAVDAIEVEYEPLPVVVNPERALEPDAPLVHPEFGTNVAYRIVKEGGDVEAAFASAPHTRSLRIIHSRVAQVPMEPRAVLASYDRAADLLTVWRSTQSPFANRAALAAVLGRPQESIRVIAPDVGGAFGAKSAIYPDELTAILMAMELGVPVRWSATRMEDLMFTLQGRDQTNLVDVAFDGDGRILGLKAKVIHNVGGVLLHPMAAPPSRVTDFATGAYRIPAARIEGIGVYTNTGPVGPYRGAGRPEAAYIAERTIEAVAQTLGLDPLEARRRNFVSPGHFPFKNAVGSVYDSGNYDQGLRRALEIAGYDGLRVEQRAARARGDLMGIGVATTIEVSAQGNEYGSVEIQPDGSVIARTGSSSHGQGHETSFAQVIADQLGVPFERVTVRHGDTADMPSGGGTGGSKSMVLGGGALSRASDKVRDKAVRVAAAMLEVSPDDLAYVRGGVEVQGAPERRLDLGDIARAAAEGIGLPDHERGLRDEDRFEAGGSAIPFAAIVAVVRIDRDTGRVRLTKMVAVDDIGTVVNPLIVDGQIAGGLTQGIAEALYERVAWDENGQPLTATLQDYAVPTAGMVPGYILDFTNTPSPHNPLGAKGVGESGTVSAPPAVTAAVLDALAPLGIHDLGMPFTSEKVWQAIQQAGANRVQSR
ncbi:MAG: molybdopterin-dependent oxidoreductase [Chloroflexi bacterium]|nr:molybdopterin-dependent oxidoreductase [Chloroflexota bacterium]